MKAVTNVLSSLIEILPANHHFPKSSKYFNQ
uniref:Uncharacterized protein n=1 Tax=Anguilla anguilla TaxID=7936 RepID=A0A0E9RGT5_ANGAN